MKLKEKNTDRLLIFASKQRWADIKVDSKQHIE
jgi:hypothetical protein